MKTLIRCGAIVVILAIGIVFGFVTNSHKPAKVQRPTAAQQSLEDTIKDVNTEIKQQMRGVETTLVDAMERVKNAEADQ